MKSQFIRIVALFSFIFVFETKSAWALTLVCSSGWPGTHDPPGLRLPGAGITDVQHHAQPP
jgi:hypothetical protein